MNPYAESARIRKALSLSYVLRKAGANAATASQMGTAQWLLAAKAAGCKAPSLETQKLTIEMLGFEPSAPSDPFAGF